MGDPGNEVDDEQKENMDKIRPKLVVDAPTTTVSARIDYSLHYN